jgi:hypothetical protein
LGFLFVSVAVFEPDSVSYEAEVGADLVGEELLEREVELEVLVSKRTKVGGVYRRLGSFLDAHAAVHVDGRTW